MMLWTAPPGGQQEFDIVLHSRAPMVAEEDDLALGAGRLWNCVRFRGAATIAEFWRAMAATRMTRNNVPINSAQCPWPYVQAIDVFGTLLQHRPKGKKKRREKST